MLRRCVDGVQLQRLIADIDHIMPRTCRDHNRVPIFHPALKVQSFRTAPHLDQPISVLDAEELINIRMSFDADVLPYWDTHQCYLQMSARPERTAEIVVPLRRFLDVNHIGIRPVIPSQIRALCLLPYITLTLPRSLLWNLCPVLPSAMRRVAPLVVAIGIVIHVSFSSLQSNHRIRARSLSLLRPPFYTILCDFHP